MAGPLDRLRRLAGGARDTTGTLVGHARDAYDWLSDNAPALVHGVTDYAKLGAAETAGAIAAPLALGLTANPLVAAPVIGKRLHDNGLSGLKDDAWNVAKAPFSLLGVSRDIGNNLAGEPAAFLANRAIDNTPAGEAGPWSGRELKRLDESGTGGAAVAGGLRLATDPTVYGATAPIEGAGVLGAAGNFLLGGFGRDAVKVGPSAFAVGAGSGVGERVLGDQLKAHGWNPQLAEAAGGAAGGLAAGAGLSALGKLRLLAGAGAGEETVKSATGRMGAIASGDEALTPAAAETARRLGIDPATGERLPAGPPAGGSGGVPDPLAGAPPLAADMATSTGSVTHTPASAAPPAGAPAGGAAEGAAGGGKPPRPPLDASPRPEPPEWQPRRSVSENAAAVPSADARLRDAAPRIAAAAADGPREVFVQARNYQAQAAAEARALGVAARELGQVVEEGMQRRLEGYGVYFAGETAPVATYRGADAEALALQATENAAERYGRPLFMREIWREPTITKSPDLLAREAAWLAAAPDETARANNRIQFTRPEHLVEYRALLDVQPDSEAAQALDALRAIYDGEFARNRAAGVKINAFHANDDAEYVNRAWDRGTSQGAVRGRRSVGAKQGAQLERLNLSTPEMINKGYTPKWRDIGDLVEARLLTGGKMVADAQIVKALKETPDWLLWDSDLAQAVGNYVPLDIARIQRMFPTLDRADALRILNDVQANVVTPADAFKQLRGEQGVVAQRPWVRQDVAKELRNAYGASPLQESAAGRAVEGAVGAARSLRLGYDVAMVGRLLPQSAAFSPTAFGRALRLMLQPGAFAEAMRDPARLDAAYYLHLTPRGGENPLLGQAVGGGLVERAAEAAAERLGHGGPPGKAAGSLLTLGNKLEAWQYNTVIPALQTELFLTKYQAMRGQARYAVLSDHDLKTQVASAINKTLGQTDFLAKGHGPLARSVERLALLSPSWTLAQKDLVVGLGQRGPEGDLIRRFWAGVALSAVASSVALSLIGGNDYSPAAIQRLIDPRSPESVTNPLSGRFLTAALPGEAGGFNVWGPVLPLARTLLSPAARGVGTATEQRESGAALWAAIAQGAEAGVRAAAGFDDRINGLPDWMSGRKSIPLGLLEQWLKNKDSRGYAIATAADPAAQLAQRLSYTALQLTPATFASALDTDTAALPSGVQSARTAALAFGANFVGANYRAPSQDPAAHRQAAAAFLAGQGIHPTDDPVGRLRAATASGDIDRATLATFQASQPELYDYIRQRRKERSDALGGPVGKEAAQRYQAGRDREAARRDARIKAAAATTTNGNDYRREVEGAWNDYIGGVQALAGQFGLGQTLDEADQNYTRLMGGQRTTANRIDQLLDRYQRIRPADETREGREAAALARRAFLDGLSPDERGLFEQYADSRAQSIGGAEYRRYVQAQRLMSQYSELPAYLALDAQQGRAVSRLVGQAREYARYSEAAAAPGAATRVAMQYVLFDQASSPEQKAYAIAELKGRLKANPARAQFLRGHPELARYYSDLNEEYTDRLAAQRAG